MPFLCNNALNNSYLDLNFTNSCYFLLSATSGRNGITRLFSGKKSSILTKPYGGNFSHIYPYLESSKITKLRRILNPS